MKPHKWAKEIISYLNGEKVYGRMDTHKSIIAEFEVNQLSQFDVDSHSFYLKPQPKEPQYLYVYRCTGDGELRLHENKDLEGSRWKLKGKIKLEEESE